MKTSTFSLIFLLLHSVSFSQSLSRKLIDRMDIVKTMGVIEESVQEEDTGKVIYLNFEDDSFSKQMQGAQRRSDSFLESFWDEDEDVPWFGLFLFSDFLNPIKADTLASERILSEWNQFMLCGGYPVVSMASCTRKEAEDSLIAILSVEEVFSQSFGKHFWKDDVGFQSLVCRFIGPDAIFSPFFVYYLDLPDPGVDRQVGVSGSGYVWFLRNDTIYTGLNLDESGKLRLLTLEDDLSQVDTSFARWINSRTLASRIPIDIRREIVSVVYYEHLPLIRVLFPYYPFYGEYRPQTKKILKQRKNYYIFGIRDFLPSRGEGIWHPVYGLLWHKD